MKLTKRKSKIKDILNKSNIKKDKSYDMKEAISILKEMPKLKFKDLESFDISIRLGIDATKSDQIIRSSTILPHGNGKKIKVAVFADGADEKDALEAGADKSRDEKFI